VAKLPLDYPLIRDTPSLQAFGITVHRMYHAIAAAFNYPDQGTTGGRPTQQRVIGQTYFDHTLGIPIWWNGTAWVNASGTAV